jgi:transcriptional regulator with XRE-family HTH domain
MMLRAVIGDELRRIRLNQGRTLRDVSKTAVVSLGYLSEIERGVKEPSSEMLAAICAALDTSVANLITVVAAQLRAADQYAQVIALRPRVVGKAA